jgi:hypothetical protein
MRPTHVLRHLFLAILIGTGAASGSAGATVTSSRADFYVAPTGNDMAAGTREAPFATLERARDAVRDLKRTRPDKDIVVLLRDGYHRLPATVLFGIQDSAGEGHTITYAAYPGERPVLGAGVPVTGWKRLTDDLPGLSRKAKGNLWQAPAPPSIDRCTSLFRDGKTLRRSRSGGFTPTSSGKSHTELHFPDAAIPRDTAARGLDLRIVPTHPWIVNLLPITKVDSEKKIAATSVPGTYPLDPLRWGYYPEGTAWLENGIEFLDSPGEWAFDARAKRFYLWPGSAAAPTGVVAPRLTELVRVEGDIDYEGSTDTPVRGLVFRGLMFTHAEHCPWLPDKTGRGLQHDWEMFDRPTAMLRFRGAEDCAVEQCEFGHSGAAAIRCDLHAQRIHIARNHIHHVGGAGVLLAGYGPGVKDVNHHNTVVNNHIHHVGQVLWHAPGIFAWQSGSNRIAHNLVHHTPYTAIVVSGRIVLDRNGLAECSKTVRWKEIDAATGNASRETGWGRGTALKPWRQREPFLHARRNLVEYNDIHHCMLILSDGNGIYVSGAGDGNQIRFNRIHDVDSPSMLSAIRCDDDQHGVTIHGNIVANCCGDGIVIKGTNDITNNIVCGLRGKTPDGVACLHCRGCIVLPYGHCTGAVIERNLLVADELGTRVLSEKRKSRLGAALLRHCRADRNLYFSFADPDWGARHFAAQRKYGIEQHSIAANPRFLDPSAGDFRLGKDSPAIALGFVPIDQDRIGPSAKAGPDVDR